jgi:hypothetical protein
MNEKLKGSIVKTAVLTMRGKLKNSEGDMDDEAELNCLEEDVLCGKYPVIIGHPESWGSARGQRLLLELKKRDMILLVGIDEFHQGQVGSWFYLCRNRFHSKNRPWPNVFFGSLNCS